MKVQTILILILVTLCLLLGSSSASLTPTWIENNRRHFQYSPLTWGIPGISTFWAYSLMAFSYLSMMAGFGRQDLVVQFYNDLVLVYMPMTGLS